MAKQNVIHPLDPLTRDEFVRGVQLVQGDSAFRETMRFHHAQLLESDKAAMDNLTFAETERFIVSEERTWLRPVTAAP